MKTGRIYLRGAAALMIVWMGFLFVANVTTDAWYYTSGWWLNSLRTLTVGSLIAFVVMAPVSCLPFLGLPWRRVLLGMACVSVLSVYSAEVFGRAQEWLLLHTYGLTPTQSVYVDRWWPFDHHSIAYSPNSGWCGWD